MWVSKKEFKGMIDAHNLLVERVKELEGNPFLAKPGEFVIERGNFLWPHSMEVADRKSTTIDYVLRLILRHIGLEVKWNDGIPAHVTIEKAAKTTAKN